MKRKNISKEEIFESDGSGGGRSNKNLVKKVQNMSAKHKLCRNKYKKARFSNFQQNFAEIKEILQIDESDINDKTSELLQMALRKHNCYTDISDINFHERIEFLGDRVANFVVVSSLCWYDDATTKHSITPDKSNAKMEEIAVAKEIKKYVLDCCGGCECTKCKNCYITCYKSDNLNLADLVEKLLGVVFVEKGLERVAAVIKTWWEWDFNYELLPTTFTFRRMKDSDKCESIDAYIQSYIQYYSSEFSETIASNSVTFRWYQPGQYLIELIVGEYLYDLHRNSSDIVNLTTENENFHKHHIQKAANTYFCNLVKRHEKYSKITACTICLRCFKVCIAFMYLNGNQNYKRIRKTLYEILKLK